MAQFYIKAGDTSPNLDVRLIDPNGNAVSLTGSTVTFTMKDQFGTTTINAAATTFIDAANGKVRYTWVTGNTSTTGDYTGFFKVTFSGGQIETFPNFGTFQIQIVS